MGQKLDKAKENWHDLKSRSGFRDFMLFIVFVCVSTIIWFVLAFNDSAQDHFNVRLQIINQPDSVIFISEVPEKLHVVVSDKGTSLWRNGYLKHPSVSIDFKEYSSDGILRYSYSDLQSSLKETFGGNAQITSVSLDSLQLFYTTSPGKRVPVVVDCSVFPASGSTLEGSIKASPSSVLVYSDHHDLDTIHFARTEHITVRDLNETTSLDVKIQKIRNCRTIPSSVVVTIPIEPLVRREAMITVTTDNVPPGEELILFPSKVPVEYYVAMSRLGDDEDQNIELVVDYNDIHSSASGKLHVKTLKYPDRLKNLTLRSDSVEYAIIKE